ncbi:MAG: hypothetical protein WAL50_17530 [Kineosporiaceae bacterium]
MTMRRRAAALIGAALVATAVPAVDAVSPASATTSRSFSCQGTISRNYTLQKVTGTLTGATPSNVTVRNYVDRVLVTSQAPSLDNAWWSGYWKTTYALNQWKVGKDASSNTYHLMLPGTPIGGAFQGLLVSEFAAGGNWQNWMSCTAA